MQHQPVVCMEFGYPVLEVCGGVAIGVLVGDTGESAQKRRAYLGDQFFLAVELVPEAGTKGAVQAGLVPGAVHQCMEEGAVKEGAVEEAEACRHVDGVG